MASKTEQVSGQAHKMMPALGEGGKGLRAMRKITDSQEGGRILGFQAFCPLPSLTPQSKVLLQGSTQITPKMCGRGEGGVGNPPSVPGRKGERNFSRELPAPCMGPEGAAQLCPASTAALKFLEQGLGQRRTRNTLHRLFLLPWEAPGPGRGPGMGLGRRKPGPAASGMLGRATPEGGTMGGLLPGGLGVGVSSTQAGILEGTKEGQQSGGRPS